ncbi:MAG: transcriptional regulator [Pseudonocardiaceae bacterium]|nr:transcriptional regulator [Pseudonocardiaceae bacterium]
MDEVRVALLGGFECASAGVRIALPLGAQRLLALLALRGGMNRAAAGECLWPDSTRGRAAANLRSALWRGRQIGDVTLIDRANPRLQLAPTIGIDLQELMSRVRGIRGSARRSPATSGWESMVDALSRDLLPDWCDDWLVLERERWDQFRLHALEGLVQQLLGEEQYMAALQTALVTIAIEPIRETAHRLVIELHIAEGNGASALRHYQRYRGLLQRELGVAPSKRMDQLVRPLMAP